MKTYKVTGMSCAACSARVERAVSGVPGVTSCAVNLLTGQLGVEGGAEADIFRAVTDAGYGIGRQEKSGSDAPAAGESLFANTEFYRLRRNLFLSVGFVIVLMYLSMGKMFGLPMPDFLRKPAVNAITQAVLSLIVLVIHNRFFRNGLKGVLHGAPNMDTLVAMGSGASYLYSVAGLIGILRATSAGDAARAMELLSNLYFDSAAMILALITVGKTLEAYSKGRTTDALRSLYNLAPKQARLVRDGEIVTVSVSEVKVGDIFEVRPGDAFPADGEVVEGESAVDESALTGESIPVDKKAGDAVATATMNQSGNLRCRATAVGEDNTLSKIIRMVTDASATKAPIANTADRIAGVFVPIVIVIAVFAAAVWLLVGQTFGYALARGVSVLVISCPCALGLATPVAIMVGSGVSAKHGILFKNAVALENCGRVGRVALDKTGTITEGMPKVTDAVPAEGVTKDELLTLAAVMESGSEHPLAKAILVAAPGQVERPEVFRALSGSGVEGTYKGKSFAGGKRELLSDLIPASATEAAAVAAGEGMTPLFFAYDGRYLGMIAVADTLREDSTAAVALLRKMNVRTVMLTGDRAATAKVIGQRVGIDEIRAEVLPDGKQQVIRDLQGSSDKLVAMVGDGINDAPALTAADIGIAIGAGTEVAIDAADVVVMNRCLADVCAAIDVSRSTLRIIRQNLAWALVYNLFGIPLAAGAFVKLFGWELNPMFGAAAMSVSSFIVVMNALRLNRWKYPQTDGVVAEVHEAEVVTVATGAEVVTATAETEVATMAAEAAQGKENTMSEILLHVEGMMCEHCQARVKKCLEELPGVSGAEVSHKEGTALVTTDGSVSAETLKAAVEAQGYKVV
ncbi:MAG: heavy metal translocating P-type ATPase [Lachnospiraceae bacterium]|nr:heavy metal translocating P-type ATPase [Lachnospiraceae bacterium]